MPNQIAQLLTVNRIFLNVDADSRQQLFEWLGRQLAASLGVKPDMVTDSLLSREKLGSTALGHGVAVPHGRIKGLKSACGAWVTLNTELPFDAPDQSPVSMLFVLFVPIQATDVHLQILSELAQLFGDIHMRQRLQSCGDSNAVWQLIRNWQSGESV